MGKLILSWNVNTIKTAYIMIILEIQKLQRANSIKIEGPWEYINPKMSENKSSCSKNERVNEDL